MLSYREHFLEEGPPKLKLTEEYAKQRAAELGMSAYPCSWPGCNSWHLGRSRD